MRKIYILITLIIFSLFSQYIFCQKNYSHIIILKNGSEYRGALIKIDNNNIVFNLNGEDKIFNKNDVSSIQLHQKRMYEDVQNVNEINDEEIKSLFKDSDKFKTGQDQQIVTLLDKIKVDFIDKNTLKINIKKAFKVLNVQGKDYSTQYFYYFKNISRARLLYGITISKDGKVSGIDDSAINDEPVNNQYPQYNLLNRIKFGLKNVDIGSVFVWEAEIIRHRYDISRPFYLEKQLMLNENVYKQDIEVISGNDFNYAYYPGKMDFHKGKTKKEFRDGKFIFTYKNEFIPGFTKSEENIPPDGYIIPFFCFSPVKSWKQISSDYYAEYFETPPSDDIKKMAISITTDEKEPLNQLKLLYNYVNRKIELGGVSIQDSYFTPLPDNILTNAPSLNVLDKSYLFTRMAQSLSIPVKMFFYIKNFNNPLLNSCPSLSQFDSVVCEYMINNKPFYFSFENNNFNYNQYYYSLSGADALEISGRDAVPVKLKKTNSADNEYHYDYLCELSSDNSMNIKKTTTVAGSDESNWRNDRFLSKDEFDKALQEGVNCFGNDASVLNYKFINRLDDFEKPVIFEENIHINNYAINSGEKIKLIKIPELRYSASMVNNTARRFPFAAGSPYRAVYTYQIIIPKNYKVGYLPKSINIENEYTAFSSEYKASGNKIIIRIVNTLKTDIIPVMAYRELKKIIEEKAEITNDWIILEEE